MTPRFFAFFCALLALGLAPACSSTTRVLTEVRGPTPRVRQVHLEGVKRFSQGEMLSYLHIDETSRLPFTKDYFVDPAIVAVDARRIEDLYRSRGYYQARVLGIEAKVDDDGEFADVHIRVSEGLPARVTSLRFVWSPDAALGEAARRKLEREAPLRQDGPFETVLLDASIGSLRAALLADGFPLAQVKGSADVHEGARQAEVELRVAPGPRARVESVRVDGLSSVPKDLCLRELDFAIGKLYSPALMQQIEDSLKGMRVFRWVATVPPSEVKDGRLAVVVRVSEADPHSVTFGPELALEAVRWQEQVSARYTYTNLFGNLTRLDLKASAGYAELPNPWDAREHGPVARVEPGLQKKGILEQKLLWSFAPSASVDIQEGYQYWTLGYRAGVARWFFGWLSAGLSHNLNRVDYFHQSSSFDGQSTALGLDFRDPYLLSYAELQGSAYFVDTIKSPTKGFIFDASYDMAGSVFGGAYDYHKVLLVARGYEHPFRRLQIVSRLQAGSIIPYGASPGAPIDYRFYLGGATGMRGFGSRRLSPKLEDCPEGGGECKLIPIGGYSMLQGTLELRLLLADKLSVFGPFSLVGFGEAGDVRAGDLDYDASAFSYTAGPGLRIGTPLGLVRFDAGFRLNREAAYAAEPGYGLYFGLGEAL